MLVRCMRTNVSDTRPVTSTKEDYIRAMYILELEEKELVKVTQVAKRLKLSKSTVSERIKELVRDGFSSRQAILRHQPCLKKV